MVSDFDYIILVDKRDCSVPGLVLVRYRLPWREEMLEHALDAFPESAIETFEYEAIRATSQLYRS